MKHLGDVDICGIPYRVEERAVKEDQGLGDAYAYSFHSLALIVVRAGQTPEAFRNCILHEVMHGIWEQSGLREAWVNVEDPQAFEETSTKIIVPHLISALASMKKWRTK